MKGVPKHFAKDVSVLILRSITRVVKVQFISTHIYGVSITCLALFYMWKKQR